MNIKKLIGKLASSVTVALVAGCMTNDPPYQPPDEPRGRGPIITSYDLQQCAVAVIDSMLANRNLDQRLREQFPGYPKKRPVIVVELENIRNSTLQMGVRLDSMMDTIRSRLINSSKFDFVEYGGDADYTLVGTLVEDRIVDEQGTDSYYKLSMRLLNRRTDKFDWSGEKELRKVTPRPLVGW